MTAPPVKQFDLLCENCGYVLSGLDRDGACPECGRPIAQSLPSARTLVFGTSASVPWFSLARELMTRPDRALPRLRMDVKAARAFCLRTNFTVALMTALGTLAIWRVRGEERPQGVLAFFSTIFSSLPLIFSIAFITLVGLLVIRLIALKFVRELMPLRPRKLPEAVSRVVVDHCALAWFPGTFLLASWNTLWGLVAYARTDGMVPWFWPIGCVVIVGLSFVFWAVCVVLVARRFRFANAPGAY